MMDTRQELEDALSDQRKELAAILRSFIPKDPQGDDSGTEEAIAWTLEQAAQAVERGHQ